MKAISGRRYATSGREAKQAPATRAHVLTGHRSPERSSQPSPSRQRAEQVARRGSPQTPPHTYAPLLGQGRASKSARAGVLRQLHSGYGNSYVGGVVRGRNDGGQTADEEQTQSGSLLNKVGSFFGFDEGEEDEPAAGAEEPGAEEKPEEDAQTSVSGTLGPIDGGTVGTFGCDAQRRDDSAASDAGAGSPARPRKPLQFKLDVSPAPSARRGLKTESAGTLAREDPVSGNIFAVPTISRGGVKQMKGFGRTETSVTLDNITWKAEGGAVTVAALLMADIHWDVTGQGRTDITGPADPNVDATNYDQVIKDLTPDADGQPPRLKFWSENLTVQHEWVHIVDDFVALNAFAAKTNQELSKKNINVPWWITDDDAKRIKFNVDGLLRNVAAEANVAIQENYVNGGETRAYAAGKAAYLSLAAAIKQRAEAETWPEWEP